jgi:hypothetical protein
VTGSVPETDTALTLTERVAAAGPCWRTTRNSWRQPRRLRITRSSLESGRSRVAAVRGFQGTQERGTICHPVLVRSYIREGAKLDELRQQAEGGQLTLRVAATLPAEQAAEAHHRLEAGGVRGRLILEF